MSKKAVIPPFVNQIMKFILRSPLQAAVSKDILLITFRGQKSGKTYTTPVSYTQTGDQITIFTHANWWKKSALRSANHSTCPGLGTPGTARVNHQ